MALFLSVRSLFISDAVTRVWSHANDERDWTELGTKQLIICEPCLKIDCSAYWSAAPLGTPSAKQFCRCLHHRHHRHRQWFQSYLSGRIFLANKSSYWHHQMQHWLLALVLSYVTFPAEPVFRHLFCSRCWVPIKFLQFFDGRKWWCRTISRVSVLSVVSLRHEAILPDLVNWSKIGGPTGSVSLPVSPAPLP